MYARSLSISSVEWLLLLVIIDYCTAEVSEGREKQVELPSVADCTICHSLVRAATASKKKNTEKKL